MGEESFETFRERQTSPQVKALSKPCLLTVAGIKTLKTKFAANSAEWSLVVKKASTFLKL